MQKIEIGEAAETLAESFLSQQGLITRARNFKCKQGEIDLVMLDGSTLVFIEVRLRTNKHYTQAAESVNYAKQRKIIKAAQVFLLQHRLQDKLACRFDVVAMNQLNMQHVEWIKNAFSL